MNIQQACDQLAWPYSKGCAAYEIFREGAVRHGSFQLKNSTLSPSPLFINLRTPLIGGPLSQTTINRIGGELLIASFTAVIAFDLVVGIPRAGEPLAEFFYGLFANKNLNVNDFKAGFRKQGSGEKRRIVDFQPLVPDLRSKRKGKRVLLIDDVITGADTKFEAAEAVETAGYEVAAFVVAIDREQGGRKALEKQGYRVVSAWKISELLEFYVLLGLMTGKTRKEIMDYIERTKIV